MWAATTLLSQSFVVFPIAPGESVFPRAYVRKRSYSSRRYVSRRGKCTKERGERESERERHLISDADMHATKERWREGRNEWGIGQTCVCVAKSLILDFGLLSPLLSLLALSSSA